MSIKEFLDTHPLSVLMSVGVSVAVVTIAIVNYLSGAKFERQQAEFDQRLASIGISSASQQVGIQRSDFVFIEGSETDIDPDLVFDLQGQFYHRPVPRSWTFQRTTESNLEDIFCNPNAPTVADGTPIAEGNIWFWSGQSVTGDIESACGRVLYPYILIHKVDQSDLENAEYAILIEQYAEEHRISAEEARLQFPIDRSAELAELYGFRFDFSEFAEHQVQSIVIGLALKTIYNTDHNAFLTAGVSEQDFRFVSYLEIHRAAVAGLDLYVRRDNLILRAGDQFYVVRVVVPSLEPVFRGSDVAFAREFLLGLKFKDQIQ